MLCSDVGRRHVCVATRNADAQGQGCHRYEVVTSFGEIAAEDIMVRQEEDEEAAAEPEDEDDEDDGGESEGEDEDE